MDGKTISTIGRERRTNPALQLDQEQFLDYQLANTPPLPDDFHNIKKANVQNSATRVTERTLGADIVNLVDVEALRARFSTSTAR